MVLIKPRWFKVQGRFIVGAKTWVRFKIPDSRFKKALSLPGFWNLESWYAFSRMRRNSTATILSREAAASGKPGVRTPGIEVDQDIA